MWAVHWEVPTWYSWPVDSGATSTGANVISNPKTFDDTQLSMPCIKARMPPVRSKWAMSSAKRPMANESGLMPVTWISGRGDRMLARATYTCCSSWVRHLHMAPLGGGLQQPAHESLAEELSGVASSSQYVAALNPTFQENCTSTIHKKRDALMARLTVQSPGALQIHGAGTALQEAGMW